MIVTFKSDDYFFKKEKAGVKPNTIRKVDWSDERFELLKNYSVNKIQIINCADFNESFTRDIKDITFWKDFVIISWEHKEK